MEDVPQKILSVLSLRAISVLKQHNSEQNEILRCVEKLKIDIEADKIDQINSELELKIENERRNIQELSKIDVELRERLEIARLFPLKDTKQDVEVTRRRYEDLLETAAEKPRDVRIDVCLLDDFHKEIGKLKKEDVKLDEALSQYEGLSPDIDVAKSQIKALAEEVKALEAMRAGALESDITKCVSSMSKMMNPLI